MGLLKKSLPAPRVRCPSLPRCTLGALAASSSAVSTSYAKRDAAGVLPATGLAPASCAAPRHSCKGHTQTASCGLNSQAGRGNIAAQSFDTASCPAMTVSNAGRAVKHISFAVCFCCNLEKCRSPGTD